MLRSTNGIITSHVGALPRPAGLGGQYAKDKEGSGLELDVVIREVVEKQKTCGIDVVNDGEYSKYSFIHYVAERLAGMEEIALPEGVDPGAMVAGRDVQAFPEYYHDRGGVFPFKIKVFGCEGPLSYIGQEAIAVDIANLKSALANSGAPEGHGFLTAISPATVEVLLPNSHYQNQEYYLKALCDALHEEYKAVIDAGLILQIDDPGLAHAWQARPDWSIADCRKFCESRVEALNYALSGLPPEQVRLHVCWGSFHGPHATDFGLEHFLDILYRVNAECFSIEGANPRHEHEWTVFRDNPLPDGKSLMAGVVAHVADTIEHPELVAQRIERWASVVGKENIIAGPDCGLARVHHEICWAKMDALVEGAAIASDRLWS